MSKKLELIGDIDALCADVKKATQPHQQIETLKQVDSLMVELFALPAANDLPETFISVPELEVKTPNKNIVLGFDGVNGFNRTATNIPHIEDGLNVDGGRYISVYHNLRGGEQIAFDLRALNSFKGEKVSYLDAEIIDPKKDNGGTLRGIINQKANKKSAFDSAASKADIERYTKAAQLAANFINNAFPLEYKGFTINTNGVMGFFVEKDGAMVLEQNAIKTILKRIDNGELQLVIDAKSEEKRLEEEQRHAEYLADMAKGNKAAGIVTDEQFKDVQNYFDNDTKLVGNDYVFNAEYAQHVTDTLANFNQKRLKLTPEQTAHVNEIVRIMRGHNFNIAQVLLGELVRNEQITVEEAPASHNEDPMLEAYRNGDFNNQPANEFKATVKLVADKGMDILEVRSGVDAWFDYDKSRNQLEAA